MFMLRRMEVAFDTLIWGPFITAVYAIFLYLSISYVAFDDAQDVWFDPPAQSIDSQANCAQITAMSDDRSNEPRPKNLTPAAKRALAEAEARRAALDEAVAALPAEKGGRKKGLEPTRYGDWEKGGVASDF